MSDKFVCGTPGSGLPKKTFTAAENARDRALLEAKTRAYLAQQESKYPLQGVVYKAVEVPKKRNTLFRAWIGFLFLFESTALGVTIFGGYGGIFLVGCTALNFFVIAPVAAAIYACLFGSLNFYE